MLSTFQSPPEATSDSQQLLRKAKLSIRIRAALQVQQEARRAVASMLERASMSDRIKSVMALLLRYETLFSLPARIMHETDRDEYDTVSGYIALVTCIAAVNCLSIKSHACSAQLCVISVSAFV